MEDTCGKCGDVQARPIRGDVICRARSGGKGEPADGRAVLRECGESAKHHSHETKHGRISGFSPLHLATLRRGRFSDLLSKALGFSFDRTGDPSVSMAFLRKIFEACSPDGVQRRLFEKVAEVAENIGVDYIVVHIFI